MKLAAVIQKFEDLIIGIPAVGTIGQPGYIPAVAGISGVNSFACDWPYTINEVAQVYPKALLVPPKSQLKEPYDGNFRYYNIELYWFDINSSNGAALTKAQRETVWQNIQGYTDALVTKMRAANMVLMSDITEELNDGNLGKDDLIYSKLTFILRVNNC